MAVGLMKPNYGDPFKRAQAVLDAKARRDADSTATLVIHDGARHLNGDSVRFVRFVGCRLDWLDECAARGAPAYRVRRPLSEPETLVLNVRDEAELFDQMPTWDFDYGARVRHGSALRVDLRKEAVRSASGPFGHDDLAGADACAAATHWVSAVFFGALRVNVDPADGAREVELEAQSVLDVGRYTACGSDGTSCLDPVAIEIEKLHGSAGPQQR
jgi:hypothetical protein